MNTSSGISKITTLATIALMALVLSTQAGWKPGTTLPDLSKFQLEGKIPSNLSGKVILIDFWASWCGPCKASFPVLNDLQNDYASKGLLVIAVNQDKTPALMTAFLEEHTVSFLTLRDANNLLVEAADVQSMPSSFIVDRSGKIRFVHTGFHGEKSTAQYKEEIEKLLNEKEGGKK